MRPSSHALGTGALAVLALVGTTCGGGGGKSLGIDELESEVIAASCRFTVMCGTYPDMQTCVASLQTQESLFATLKVDIANGIVKYDGVAARACIDAYNTINGCLYTSLFRLNDTLSVQCDKVFMGTLPAGSACYFSEECAAGGTCDKSCTTDGCCAGTCLAAPTTIPAGGDCSQTTTVCANGSTCRLNQQGTSPSSICIPEFQPGAACTPSDTCVLPYYCGAGGTCTAPPARGEPCGDVSGSIVLCNDPRDNCDPNTNVCAPGAPAGSACGGASDIGCNAQSFCDGTTCIAIGGPGASCDPAFLQPCLGNLECDTTNHCALPPKGASCR